jgi:predicted nucleic-acid-binding protein
MKKNNADGWLDTNVILRFLLRDDDTLFQKASVLFEKAERGELTLYLHPLVLAELVWTLESFYDIPKADIADILTHFMDADGISTPDKEVARDALQTYKDKNVDYIDAYLARYALQKGPGTVYTMDRKHFSRLGGCAVIL